MSQHASLLTLSIRKGIIRGETATEIVDDFAELLETLEYDDSITEHRTVVRHAYNHAKWMMTQKEGLYGVTHAKLDKFVTELWCANQWLSD